MKKRLLNVATIAVLMLSAVACSEEEQRNLDNGMMTEEEDETNPGEPDVNDFDIFVELSNDEMVYVEGGVFWMGAQSSTSSQSNYDSSAESDESPVHAVTLSSFYMGKYEVTQALWEYVMNYTGLAADGTTMTAFKLDDEGYPAPWLGSTPNSTYGFGDNYPAYYVSYNDIVDYFLPRLNQITGKSYRLPTEAEWEYAARGGQKGTYTRTQGASGIYYKYAGSNNIDKVAWYNSNSAHLVGTKSPNALGLYDMSGNVYEWCSDWYGGYSSTSVTNPAGPSSGSGRVNRGGSWYSSPVSAILCRVSNRNDNLPLFRYHMLGFRLALSL